LVGQKPDWIHLARELNDELPGNPFDEEFKELVSAFAELLQGIT
jgi:hypothetical protein